MHVRILVLLITSTAAACATPLQEARTLGETDAVAAVAAAEALLQAAPGDTLTLEAVGDLHLTAMASPEGDKAHATAAIEAYGQLVKDRPRVGIYRAKLALAESLAGVDGAAARAGGAWGCCQTGAALPLIEQSGTVGVAVAQGSWTIAETWTAAPGFDASATGRMVLKRDEAPISAVIETDEEGKPMPEDKETVLPKLKAGYAAPVVAAGDPVTFVDRTNPRTTRATAYVDGHKSCDQPFGGFSCRARKVRRTALYTGPCWHAEEPVDADAVLIDPETVNWKTVRCVQGKPRAQSGTCPDDAGSCEVAYDQISFPKLKVAASDVWLLPDSGPSPEQALIWARDVSGTDVADRIASGELALGLPEPLVRWAARPTPDTLPQGFRLQQDSIALTWTSPAGTFTFTDGALTQWDRP